METQPERFNLSLMMDQSRARGVTEGSLEERLAKMREAELLEHFFLRVMTDHVGERGDILKVFGIKPGEVVLDVVLTINGVQVPVSSFVRIYNEQCDRMVNERAVELLKEKMGDIQNALHDIERAVTSKAAEVFGVEPDR